MKSITIHNLDELLAETIGRRAEESGESLNATVKELLALALGLPATSENAELAAKRGYRRFLGAWTADEEREFVEATQDFERLDKADWQ